MTDNGARAELPDKFWTNVERTETCWLWLVAEHWPPPSSPTGPPSRPKGAREMCDRAGCLWPQMPDGEPYGQGHYSETMARFADESTPEGMLRRIVAEYDEDNRRAPSFVSIEAARNVLRGSARDGG